MLRECVIQRVSYRDNICDVYIKDGRIEDIGEEIGPFSPEVETISGENCVLFPSLIDSHVHLREPGQEYKEDISSGLKAALAGGFSHVLAMANTHPVNDNASVTSYMVSKATTHFPSGPYLHPVGALTKGLEGKELSPFYELKEAGCVALSNDGIPVKNNELFRRALEYASNVPLLVMDHCEDIYLAEGGVMNEGVLSDRLGLKGQPDVAEALQVARDILLASYLDIPIYLCHISCEQSIELISWAKKKGIKVFAETCPHYLLWDESLVDGYNTLAKVNPPLRKRSDVVAVRQAVREGIIDVISTDHAPHADFEKEVPFGLAPNGISGLDTALSLLWSLVEKGELTYEDITRCMMDNPAYIFGIEVDALEKGQMASLVLFDSSYVWEVSETNLFSRGKNTPLLGKELKGKVSAHIIKGRLLYSLSSK